MEIILIIASSVTLLFSLIYSSFKIKENRWKTSYKATLCYSFFAIDLLISILLIMIFYQNSSSLNLMFSIGFFIACFILIFTIALIFIKCSSTSFEIEENQLIKKDVFGTKIINFEEIESVEVKKSGILVTSASQKFLIEKKSMRNYEKVVDRLPKAEKSGNIDE